jgi:hypothetical protein
MSRGKVGPREITRKEVLAVKRLLTEYVDYAECGGWQRTLSPEVAKQATKIIENLWQQLRAQGAKQQAQKTT